MEVPPPLRQSARRIARKAPAAKRRLRRGLLWTGAAVLLLAGLLILAGLLLGVDTTPEDQAEGPDPFTVKDPNTLDLEQAEDRLQNYLALQLWAETASRTAAENPAEFQQVLLNPLPHECVAAAWPERNRLVAEREAAQAAALAQAQAQAQAEANPATPEASEPETPAPSRKKSNTEQTSAADGPPAAAAAPPAAETRPAPAALAANPPETPDSPPDSPAAANPKPPTPTPLPATVALLDTLTQCAEERQQSHDPALWNKMTLTQQEAALDNTLQRLWLSISPVELMDTAMARNRQKPKNEPGSSYRYFADLYRDCPDTDPYHKRLLQAPTPEGQARVFQEASQAMINCANAATQSQFPLPPTQERPRPTEEAPPTEEPAPADS